MENINETAVMYHTQTGSDRFSYEFFLSCLFRPDLDASHSGLRKTAGCSLHIDDWGSQGPSLEQSQSLDNKDNPAWNVLQTTIHKEQILYIQGYTCFYMNMDGKHAKIFSKITYYAASLSFSKSSFFLVK